MSETTQDENAGPAPRLFNSLLATRAANTVRYSLMNIFILVGVYAMAWGGLWT